MNRPSDDTVRAYYNQRVAGKLADFTDANPRIEAAIAHLAEWAPLAPRRILEIGCSVGATSWRMARAWPEAQVIGADISPGSIAVAQQCFQRANLSYRAGLVQPGVFDGKFDLILMMDVYEHIAPADRPALHAAIRELLADESRLILTVPTPEVQQFGREHNSEGIQPVDEDIDIAEVGALACDTDTKLLCFRRVGIWEYGDYTHLALGRFQALAPVMLRQPRPFAGRRDQLKRLIGINAAAANGRQDYLGSDVLRPRRTDPAARFAVTTAERQRLALRWNKAAG